MVDLGPMQRQLKQARGTSVALYALGAIFLVPLFIGVFLVNSSASQSDQANQVSRDIASMYAQGVDFSTVANRNIARRVAEGMGMDIGRGKGVVILSKIRVVNDADCATDAARDCANQGRAVITQRYVIGNSGLGNSSFGTPQNVDRQSGNVHNWFTDATARAQDFPLNLKPGESTYAAECYLTLPESRSVYSRAMF